MRKSATRKDICLDSDKDSENEHNTSAEIGDHKSPVKNDNRLETCTNKSSPSSTEGVRENCTPEVPTRIPSPLPVLPESGSECISDSISDDVPSLTPQIPTPHSVDSLDCPKSVECTPIEESHLKSPSFTSTQCTITEQSDSTPQYSDQNISQTTPQQQHDLSFSECDTLTSEKGKLNETLGSDAEQMLADSSALASRSIVEEMEQQDMENMDDDGDEIDNNSMGDIPSDDNLQDFDSDTSTQEALRATENLEQVIAAELESSLEQTEESAGTTLNTEPLVQQREENMNMESIASVGSVQSQHSVNVPSVEPPVQQNEHPQPSPHHPHPSPHNIVSPHHHPSPHQPGPSPHLPSPHHTLSPHQNVSPQCNQMNAQMFSANQQMNNMSNANITGNPRFGSDIDVSQLAGLESPTSMSSTELQNTSGDGNMPQPSQHQQQQHRQQQQQQQQQTMGPTSFSDCAQQQQQQQQQQTYSLQFNNNQVPLSYNCGTSYMDTVNSAMLSNTGTYMPIVSSAQMNFMAAAPPNNFTQVLIQQQQQHQNQQSQRLTHNATPCPPNVRQGNPVGFGGQNSCSLAKLQQLTNGIMDIMPENQITPPPQLTPPPSVSLAPPTSLMRTMQTPNPSQQSIQQQQQQFQQQQQRQYQRQKSGSGSTSNKKNQNIAPSASPNPNVTFTPNMAIQPNTNMIPRYNIMDSYRMQQPMINTSYIAANPSFINQLRQPMQMSFNVNPMNPMNPMNAMNPQQHFPQHMQPPQSNNVYTTYGYINGPGLNMNMRR